jgi:hypothetical protein
MITAEHIEIKTSPGVPEDRGGVTIKASVNVTAQTYLSDDMIQNSINPTVALKKLQNNAEQMVWEAVYGDVKRSLARIRQDVANLAGPRQDPLAADRALRGKIICALDELCDQLSTPPR